MMNLVESPSRPAGTRGKTSRSEFAPPVHGSSSPRERAVPSTYPAWEVFRALVELRHRGPIERRQQADRLGELCRMVCAMHQIEVEVRGQLPTAPAIIVSNHLGYIDPLVLCGLMPLSPIAKSEICDWALVGVPLERLNVSFVRRGDPHSGARVLLRSLRALEAGVSVLNFPEGTTSRGGLLPFHLGAFWLSRRSGAPVVPVAIDFEDLSLCWVDRQGFLPHYAKVCWTGGPRRVRVSVAEPLDPERYRSELDLAWAARESIAHARAPYAPASPAAWR